MPDAPGQPLPPYTPLSPAAPAAVVAAYSPLSPDAPEQPTNPLAFLTITGELTVDGTTPYVFPVLSGVTRENGRPKFYDPADGDTSVFWDGVWNIEVSGVGGQQWDADEDVPTPDLVTTWVSTGGPTGTPIVRMTGFVPVDMPPPPNTIAEP